LSPGQPVEVTESEQHDGRRQDTEEEIFGRGLLVQLAPPREVEENVGRDRKHLEREEKRDEVVGPTYERCACRGNQQAPVILGGIGPVRFPPADKYKNERGNECHPADKSGRRVGNEWGGGEERRNVSFDCPGKNERETDSQH
jgi:hypothetical protein